MPYLSPSVGEIEARLDRLDTRLAAIHARRMQLRQDFDARWPHRCTPGEHMTGEPDGVWRDTAEEDRLCAQACRLREIQRWLADAHMTLAGLR